MTTAKIGDTVTFGYFYGEIEWLVLDKKEDALLLQSKNVLETMQFNKKYGSIEWSESFMRKWLNGVFFLKTFSESEKLSILETEIPDTQNPAYGYRREKSRDKVFLLSIEEAKKYYSSDKERMAFSSETAKEQGVLFDKYNGASPWWLRTPGYDKRRSAVVSSEGDIREMGAYNDYGTVSVRPAVWVDSSKMK